MLECSMYTKRYNNIILAVDIIVELDAKVLMIRRRNEPFRGYLALPGGLVEEGEKIEDAARREMKEETSLNIDLVDILGVYSEPRRDPRGHYITTVFIGRIPGSCKYTEAHANDDAADVEWINSGKIISRKVAFDHLKILLDYKEWKIYGGTFWSSKGQ
jgi:8-oxo-dGTP diphosphatase